MLPPAFSLIHVHPNSLEGTHILMPQGLSVQAYKYIPDQGDERRRIAARILFPISMSVSRFPPMVDVGSVLS